MWQSSACAAGLVKQKGFDIILPSGAVNASNAQFVFLGQGEERYKVWLRELEAKRPGQISAEFQFHRQGRAPFDSRL
jgi:glycogen synthase